MQQYQTTIGLEIHVQLKTSSKMFCSSSAEYFGAPPNTHVCPVCLGLPGALPVINQKAVEAAVKFGLALNCSVPDESKFDRKNYFYPDLPKGFQISQFDLPVSKDGYVLVNERKIRINRAHLEEDTGKLIHLEQGEQKASLIDFNRSGVPLMEVVSEPDIESPEEAKAYAKKIHQVARYLEVSDADMEKAGMRFDANVSVRKEGVKELGTKVEIKNINSFRFLEKALIFEITRQIKQLEKGKKIVQETRGWDETNNATFSQRTKETSPDYRYFPEPDLPLITFSEGQIKNLKEQIPELPDKLIERFQKNYTLNKNIAQYISEDKKIAQWFEDALILYAKSEEEYKSKATKLANWVVGEVIKTCNDKHIDIAQLPIEPAGLVELLNIVDSGRVNQTTAKMIFSKMTETGKMPEKILSDEGLEQMSNKTDLEPAVKEVLENNEKAKKDFLAGKEASLGFLVGQVMKITQGRANPQKVSQIIKKILENGNSD